MARARGRGRRELKSEINIVPLLDVLLVLLLIFMATAPIITQSVEAVSYTHLDVYKRQSRICVKCATSLRKTRVKRRLHSGN